MTDIQSRINLPLSEAIANRKTSIQQRNRTSRPIRRGFGSLSKRAFRTPQGRSFRTIRSFNTSTKIFISELEPHVQSSDLRDIFNSAGRLKAVNLHHNREGKSLGTAEISFAKHSDAVRACKKFDKALVDGKPMKLKMVSSVDGLANSASGSRRPFSARVGGPNRPRFGDRRNRPFGRGNRTFGRGNRTFGRGRNNFVERKNPLLRQKEDLFRGRTQLSRGASEEAKKKIEMSLDAELDAYKQ